MPAHLALILLLALPIVSGPAVGGTLLVANKSEASVTLFGTPGYLELAVLPTGARHACVGQPASRVARQDQDVHLRVSSLSPPGLGAFAFGAHLDVHSHLGGWTSSPCLAPLVRGCAV